MWQDYYRQSKRTTANHKVGFSGLSPGAPKLKSLSQMGWMLISSGFNFKLKLKWSLQL